MKMIPIVISFVTSFTFFFKDEDVYVNIRNLLKAAVKKRMMAHRRIGCMLSGL